MPKTAVPDWAAIRHAYEATDAAVAAIAAEAGIAQTELQKVRKREAWIRHKPRGVAPGSRPASIASELAPPVSSTAKTKPAAKAPPPAAPPAPVMVPAQPKRPAPSGAAHRRRLLDRLVAAISLKLSQLERRMSHDLAKDLDPLEPGDPATSTDHERETRAIGALIDNLGKVTEMETGLARSAAAGGKSGASNLADEAERCRRELAERLSRLVDAAAKDA